VKRQVNIEKVEHLKTSNVTCHPMFLLCFLKTDVVHKITIEFNYYNISLLNFDQMIILRVTLILEDTRKT
jgi:hypothetical protein